MLTFLHSKVSNDYQRRMSFATRTKDSASKVKDYVMQISNEYKNESQGGKPKRRASMNSLPADSFIEIKLVDSITNEESKMRHGSTMSMKSLFKQYAEDRNVSLKQLRFSYEGRTLFLSSAGNKTPEDLEISHLDTIAVTDNEAVFKKRQEENAVSSSDESNESSGSKDSKPKKRKKKLGKRSPCRRASWAGPEILGEEERLKLKHSRQLGAVLSEASPQFEQLRQKLNAMNLQCTPPKIRMPSQKPPLIELPLALNNPNNDGIGGKAGVPFYAVHVGATENLYTTKKHSFHGQKSISIDLHGLTEEEALALLDSTLPGWVDSAMEGSYPFVIPAVIICGGGNQILSEAVDQWIKCNDNVARAPKKKFSRRRSI